MVSTMEGTGTPSGRSRTAPAPVLPSVAHWTTARRRRRDVLPREARARAGRGGEGEAEGEEGEAHGVWLLKEEWDGRGGLAVEVEFEDGPGGGIRRYDEIHLLEADPAGRGAGPQDGGRMAGDRGGEAGGGLFGGGGQRPVPNAARISPGEAGACSETGPP
jgi:hypothetical protein